MFKWNFETRPADNQPEAVLEHLSGDFYEGGTVSVRINGKEITRKVHWDAQAGDLFVWYDRKKYFYYEF